MKRRKQLWIMGGILGLTLVVTLGVLFMDTRLETIRESGETILAVPVESVTRLSWDHDGEILSFTKKDQWHYDGDEAFPVSPQDMENLLLPFENLTASFCIEDVENYSQYGFDAPASTVRFTADGQDYTIRLGAYSQMDQQRYADLGDGNVYLLFHDPMAEFDLGLRDVILNDDIPYLDRADRITVSGPETYTILRQPEGAVSYREEDLYFTLVDGRYDPLDTFLVETFLDDLSVTNLSSYQTYTAEDLSPWGLDQPELTIRVDYTTEEDGVQQSYTLRLARDPEQLKEAEASEGPESHPVSVYAQLEGSSLVYEITPGEYETLSACGYDDLRHREIFPAHTQDITGLEIRLDGGSYSFVTQPDEENGEMMNFLFSGQVEDVSPVLDALRNLRAEEFTREVPTQRLELSLEAQLNTGERILVELYRKDGIHCIARVNGRVVALIPRSQAVDLIEQLHTIILSQEQAAE